MIFKLISTVFSDRASGTAGVLRFAEFAAKGDENAVDGVPVFFWDKFLQIFFHVIAFLRIGPAQTTSNAVNVSIDGDSRCVELVG